MKILWISNIPLPEASKLLGTDVSPFGGWLDNASKTLANNNSIELSIGFPYDKYNSSHFIKGKIINYHTFPSSKITTKDNQKNIIRNILELSKPDIVHIYGTEFDHSQYFAEVCTEMKIKFVVSIQGLVSIYSQHFMAHLPCNVQNNFTLRDMIKGGNLVMQKKEFEKRGIHELTTLNISEHIIGRTTWDKACASIINPNAQYHFCNETLREKFYSIYGALDEETTKLARFKAIYAGVSLLLYGLDIGDHSVVEAALESIDYSLLETQ